MGKMRVHELARELGMKNNDLLPVLKTLGYEVTNHMSVIDDSQVRRVKAHIAGEDGAGAPTGTVQEKRIETTVSSGRAVIRRRGKAAAEPEPAAAAEPVAAKAEEAAPAPAQTTTIIRRRRVAEEPQEPAAQAEAPAEEAAPAVEGAQAETPEAAEAHVAAAEEEAVPASAEAAEAAPSGEAPAAAAPVTPRASVSANQARILDKPKIPLSRLQSSAPAPVRPAGEDRDDEEQRRRKLKTAKGDAPGLRRRVVTKRQFQTQVLSDEDGDFERAARRRKSEARKRRESKKTEITTPRAAKRKIRVADVITVGDLAHNMGVKANEIVKRLLQLGVMATVNQGIDADTAAVIASEYGYDVENTGFQVDDVLQYAESDKPDELKARPPVVTVMGHVDHGKTSLLDAIRKSSVASGEAGGITQHIGAYSVETSNGTITFVDTPGHEAFTAMRARGAQVTDIVILVVAANDGVMPQTIEAINHAKAAGVPIIVAVNKVDLPEANPDKVRQQLTEYGLVAEEWGGETIFESVSAKAGKGIDSLLDSILLQAEVLDLKANPDKLALGITVESRLDKGRGPVATVIIKEGTLRVGDWVVAGTSSGRIRAMFDDKGQPMKDAGPSVPVEILGLSDVPDAGEKMHAVKDDKAAKQVAEHRTLKIREQELARTSKVTLEDLYDRIKEGAVQELRLVVKADVQGSVEALRDSFLRLSTDEVKVRIIHTGVGGANESDVNLASASNAIIICFNVRPDGKTSTLAEREGVEIKAYNIIYDAVDNIRKAMEGLLAPEVRESILGHAEVRQVFNVSKAGTVAGSMVTDGKVLRSAKARLLRDSKVVYEGSIASLRRLKDDVREVQQGFECGISLENFNDIKPGDVVEVYDVQEIARTLGSPAAG